MRRRICFLGTYPWPPGELDIPEDMEIWVVNEAHRRLSPARPPSRVFQMHPRDWRESERTYLNGGHRLPADRDYGCFGRNAQHVAYLRTCGVPVYGQQWWADIPTSVAYPFQEVTEALGIPLPPEGIKRLWAASSWGYMGALLLTEHLAGQTVAEWMLWGAELPLGSPRERVWEWPNLAYYLGIARGLGIALRLPDAGTSLLSAPLYAVGGQPHPGQADHWFLSGEGAIVNDGATLHLGTYREDNPDA